MFFHLFFWFVALEKGLVPDLLAGILARVLAEPLAQNPAAVPMWLKDVLFEQTFPLCPSLETVDCYH